MKTVADQTDSLLTSFEDSKLDRLRSGELSGRAQAISVLIFAVLTALGAKINLPVFDVPFTLQTIFVYGSGLFLGWKNGFLAQLTYLFLGLFFPVTAGDGVGFEYMMTRPSSGYLLGFPIAAMAAGYFSKNWRSFFGCLLSVELGSIALFLFGVSGLYVAVESFTPWDAVYRGWIKFLPFDLIKIFIVVSLYTFLRRQFR